MIRQAVVTVDSAYYRKESPGAHARRFSKKEMINLCNTLLPGVTEKIQKLVTEVHKSTLTNEVQYFPPQEEFIDGSNRFT